jgi:hypothetical protein
VSFYEEEMVKNRVILRVWCRVEYVFGYMTSLWGLFVGFVGLVVWGVRLLFGIWCIL